MDNNIEKAVKPEVSKETLLEVIKELQELVIGILEVEDEMETEVETEDTELDITPTNPSPIGDPDKNEVNWPVDKMDGQTDLEAERKNETYKSDNEDEDKWDNEVQKCWSGYTQRGMKDKGGKMVPNCVPIEKAEDYSENDQIKKSLWGSVFIPKK